MKKAILSLFASILLLTSLVLASDLQVTGTTSLTAVHGTTVSGTLTITNTNSTQNFTIVNIQGNNLTFSTSSFSLNSGASTNVSYSIVIPQYTAPNPYNYPFTITGNKTDNSVSTTSGAISVSVNSTSALSFSSPSTLTRNSNITTVTLTNTGNTPLSGIVLTLNSSSLKDSSNRQANLSISPNSGITLDAGQSQTITLSAIIPSNMNVGTYTAVLNASNSQTSTTQNIVLSQGYCTKGRVGNDFEIRTLTDEKLDNEDSWEWYPGQNIEITVKVRNDYDDDLDAVLEYDLYDTETNEFVELADNTKDISIDSDSTEEITLKFTVPANINIDSSEKIFRLYMKLYEDGNEDERCTDSIESSSFKDIEIKTEKRALKINDLEFPESALCSDTFLVTGKLLNTGRSDEDKVKLVLLNRELGIESTKEFSNLDQGESSTFSLSGIIPANATEKIYTLGLNYYYDYNSDDKTYDESDYESFLVKVQGNCQKVSAGNAVITASLETAESNVKAGKAVVILATIQNTGDSKATYVVSVDSNTGFSSVESVDPSILILEKGQSGESTITLKLNSDAEGSKTFNIKVLVDGKEIKQPVSLTIAKGFNFGNLGDTIKNNWVMIVVVLVNIILILAIIIVIVRMARN